MIERFIECYAQRAFEFAYHLCANSEEAKELVQEAFFRALKRWRQYDPAQSLENWFLTILRHLYYDGLKRYERRHSVSLDAPWGDDDSSLADRVCDRDEEALLERLERREAEEEVREVLASLGVEYRAILTLSDMQALSYEQISTILDCPLGTVRSRLSRARAAFRKAMLQRTEEGLRA
jgi:RNA polymerase sigma-70 factor (ECF subfamily)